MYRIYVNNHMSYDDDLHLRLITCVFIPDESGEPGCQRDDEH